MIELKQKAAHLPTLSHYRITEEIYQGADTVICRGLREPVGVQDH